MPSAPAQEQMTPSEEPKASPQREFELRSVDRENTA